MIRTYNNTITRQSSHRQSLLRVMRIITFGINVTSLIIGITLIVISSLFIFEKSKVVISGVKIPKKLYRATMIFGVISGCCLLVVSFVGMLGVRKKDTKCLYAYCLVVTTFFFASLVAGMFTTLYPENVGKGMMYLYKEKSLTKDIVDVLQEMFQCCGVETYHEWLKKGDGISYPISCCEIDFEPCELFYQDNVHNVGCKKVVGRYLKIHKMYVIFLIFITTVCPAISVMMMYAYKHLIHEDEDEPESSETNNRVDIIAANQILRVWELFLSLKRKALTNDMPHITSQHNQACENNVGGIGKSP